MEEDNQHSSIMQNAKNKYLVKLFSANQEWS